MILAGKAANRSGIPVVLDPVGVGATSFRTKSALRILGQVNITCIRGNAGEIANLAGGVETKVRGGVDGTDDVDMHALAEVAYSKLHIPLAITGAQDFIKDKDHLFIISNGHPILTKVTGAGCLLSSVCAAFLAISDDVALALLMRLVITVLRQRSQLANNSIPAVFRWHFWTSCMRSMARLSKLNKE